HPGLAHNWLQGEGMGLRREVASELEQLLAGRLGSIELAQRWTADAYADLRLRHAADLALKKAADGLTDPARLNKLAAWFGAATRTRALLRATSRAAVSWVGLRAAWGAADRVQSKGRVRWGRSTPGRASFRGRSWTRRRCTARTCRS